MFWTCSMGWGEKKTEMDWTCPLDRQDKESYTTFWLEIYRKKISWKNEKEMKGLKWCLEK